LPNCRQRNAPPNRDKRVIPKSLPLIGSKEISLKPTLNGFPPGVINGSQLKAHGSGRHGA
jgi:hypothetical protein